MKVGFTGTQEGMTVFQIEKLKDILSGLPDYFEFHHGDCIGSDEQAHQLVSDLTEAKSVIHPPLNDSKRAFCVSGDIKLPKAYLDRNHDIVDDTGILIVAPSGSEKVRSGTWATVRYARRKKRRLILIYPDGNVVKE